MPLLLAHRELGGEGAPPLLILHGLLGSSRNWQTAGAALAGRRRVWALDLRNQGESPWAETQGWDDQVGDVLYWMDVHRVGRAVLLGHSLGGKVAMRVACRFPERVAGLVVADIAPRSYPAHWREEIERLAALPAEAMRSRAAAEAALEPAVPEWGLRKFLLTNLARDPFGEHLRWQANLSVLLRELPNLAGNPLAPADRYAGPVLALRGERSTFCEAGDAAVFARHFPNLRFVEIPGAGHNLHVDQRAEFTARVEEFLGGLPG